MKREGEQTGIALSGLHPENRNYCITRTGMKRVACDNYVPFGPLGVPTHRRPNTDPLLFPLVSYPSDVFCPTVTSPLQF